MVINNDIINTDNVTRCCKFDTQNTTSGKEPIYSIEFYFVNKEVKLYDFPTKEGRDIVFTKLIVEFD